MNDATPKASPVRQVGDGPHEVLFAGNDSWTPCRSETDARAIATAPILEYEALAGTRSGADFAGELEQCASALERNGIGFGSRFLRRRAEEARQRNG